MKKVMLLLCCVSLAGLVHAAKISFQADAPAVGSADVAHLGESNTDAGNVEGVAGDFYGPDGATYIAHDRAGLGQTFTTGPDPQGYFMQGFWVKHVNYISGEMTWFNTTSASAQLEIRVTDPSQQGLEGFEMRVETYTTTGTEPGAFGTGGSGTGTGTWVYFELDSPILLSPNTVYGFDVTVPVGTFFFETAGLDGAASYPDGQAYTTGSAARTNSLSMDIVRDGDHTFIVDMMDGFAYLEPLNGADGVPVGQDLSWTILDENITAIDLYLGTENDPNLTAKPQYKKLSKAPATTTTYDPGILAFSTTYYWRVDAYEPNELPGGTEVVVPGPVWSFTTVPATPVFSVNPGISAVFPGESAVLSATSDSVSPLVESMRWFKVGTPDVEITMADPDVTIAESAEGNFTTSTLTIANAGQADTGNYYASATNAGGVSKSTNGSIIIKKLLAHYPFEGDPNDASGNGNDGVGLSLGAAPNNILPSYVDEGVVGKAVSLSNAYANFIDLPDGFDDFRSGITLNLWAYPTAAGGWANFIQFSNGAPNENIFFCRSGTSTTLHFRTANGTTQNTAINGNAAIALNQWQMFTVTLTPTSATQGQARLYKNGLRYRYYNTDGSFNTPSVSMPLPNVVTRLNNYIGRSAWGGDAYFTGLMDEIRIYNYALTDDEIAALYVEDTGAPICRNKPTYDFTGDCKENLADFALFAAEWLDCGLEPVEACN